MQIKYKGHHSLLFSVTDANDMGIIMMVEHHVAIGDIISWVKCGNFCISVVI